MSFSFEKSFKTALRSSWVILKLIVPIYILADVLFYYDLLSYITFIFKPLALFLGLPQEAALSIVSGLFLNLYAAIAFAAPLGLDTKSWTVLAVFLGIAHALLVETEIMKRLGLSRVYSIVLRLSVGLLVGFFFEAGLKGFFGDFSSLIGSSSELVGFSDLTFIETGSCDDGEATLLWGLAPVSTSVSYSESFALDLDNERLRDEAVLVCTLRKDSLPFVTNLTSSLSEFVSLTLVAIYS